MYNILSLWHVGHLSVNVTATGRLTISTVFNRCPVQCISKYQQIVVIKKEQIYYNLKSFAHKQCQRAFVIKQYCFFKYFCTYDDFRGAKSRTIYPITTYPKYGCFQRKFSETLNVLVGIVHSWDNLLLKIYWKATVNFQYVLRNYTRV